MIFTIVIFLLAIFFALNMGGANYAACFAPSYGGKLVSRKNARLLFMLFVVLGAVLYGSHVTETLSDKVIPHEMITDKSLIVILLSAGLGMFVANLMKIPQSTSFVTVAALAGVGLYHGNLNIDTIYYFIPFWVLLPLASFFATYGISSYVYPPRKINFWVYEKLVNHRERLKNFVILCSCYNAFSVGTNNVANVVGPVAGAGGLTPSAGLIIFAIVFGVGPFAFKGPLETAGNKIVPLGLLTASVISLVSGTLIIFASGFGVPQSFVMLQMGALFAIAILKHGRELTLKDPITQKTFFTWTINPLITLFVSYGLSVLLLKS